MKIRSVLEQLRLTFSGALCVLMAGMSVPAEVRADDTDVFFPPQQLTAVGNINPNILFIIDTSGSMGGTDGFTQTRLQRVQTAFNQILDEMTPDVNVGLMRFSNNNGGPVMFPVAPIDNFVDEVDVNASGDRTQLVQITDSASEAVQSGAASGVVTVKPTLLQIGGSSVVRVFPIGPDGSYEAEQHGSNSDLGTSSLVDAGTGRCSPDLELIYDSNSYSCAATVGSNRTPRHQSVGVQFPNVTIAKDATINSAFIEFTHVDETSSGSGSVEIRAENSAAPALYAGGTNVSAALRPFASSGGRSRTAAISWTIPGTPAPEGGSKLLTPNLQSIVQSLVNLTAWGGNNTMNFVFRPESDDQRRRNVHGRVGSTSDSQVPKLIVNHAATADNAQRRMALRFDNVQIPKGVVIKSANVMFYGAPGSDSNTLNLNIRIENTPNAAPYAATTNNISNRAATGSVSWAVPAVAIGDDVSTPDLSALLNSAVGGSSWCGGNAVSLIFEYVSGTGVRALNSTTSNSALAPTLNLAFAPDDSALGTGCLKSKIVSQIGAAKTDDSFQSGTNNYPSCAVLYVSRSLNSNSVCGSNNQNTTLGLRFQRMNIPKGATIVNAYLDFTAYAADSNTPTLSIRAENRSDAPTFASSGSHISGRVTSPGTTGSTVSWTTTAWAKDVTYSSPDIKVLIQDIVNRADWDPNKPISLFVTGPGSGPKTAYASESSLASAPRLRVQIEGAAGRLTVREYLRQIVNGFIHVGNTPSLGTLYEAARYYRGEDAFYGRTRGGGDTFESNEVAAATARNLQINNRAVYNYSAGAPTRFLPVGCSDLNLNSSNCQTEAWTGTTRYKSPISHGCQSNNIIFLSDGIPNNSGTSSGGASNKSAISLVGSMISPDTCLANPKDSNGATQNEWRCGNEITKFLYTKDQNSTLRGSQLVRTFTIAFGPDVGTDSVGAEYLRGLAINGGGQAFSANSSDQVAAVFRAIIAQIIDLGTTFVAPAVTVNTFNRLTNRNELYFALFKPSINVSWPGNLKRYQLLQQSGDSEPKIYDRTPKIAVDPASGFFTKDACSFWTANCNDGADVALGGFASKLTNTRNVYTYTSAGAPTDVDLTQTAHAVSENNGSLTKAMLGIPSATDDYRINLLKWARGIDVADEDGDASITDARNSLGDPLHSEPVLISYGGTDANPDLAVFYGDNHGYLHAVNAAANSGQEYFAFVPKELLGNLAVYYEGGGDRTSRPYGMDGPITSYIKDTNNDGSVTLAGEAAYIYAGMRRGGRNYYALDVTSRTAPKLKFQILGGTNTSLGNYTELGQTWSAPTLAKMRIGTTVYDGKGSNPPPVLVFSGGYDPAHDDKSDLFASGSRAGDGQGRAIFIARSDTGQLLWWAGYKTGTASPNLDLTTEMVYSVASSPALADLDADGLIDRLYVADTGGQVFRFILGKDADGNPNLMNATGGVIAKLSSAGAASSRHMFNTPSLALISDSVDTPFISVSLGTGHRERPLDTANGDRFYVLKDPDISNESPSALLINGDADLYDASANLAGSSDEAVAKAAKEAIGAKKGLYINMRAGEKVLTTATTFNNQVLFASFQPGSNAGGDAEICKATQGTSRFYQIRITDATPTNDLNGSSGTLTADDRSKEIPVAGLPPAPIILFPSIRVTTNADGSTTPCNGAGCTTGQYVNPQVCIGAVCFDPNVQRVVTKSYWRKVE